MRFETLRVGLVLALAGQVLGGHAEAQAQALAQSPKPPAAATPLDAILAVEYALGSQTWRDEKLAASPRHHETVAIKRGAKHLAAFVVYPETPQSAPVVLMIPEDQGLGGWARDMADQIAAMGYVVVVPDMFSGLGPNGGDRGSFPDLRSAFEAHRDHPVPEAEMTSDLNAWADWGKALDRSNGRLSVVGFAWGGGRAFWFATQRKDLSATFIFYDTAPPAQNLAGLTAPVYAFYAEQDARVTRTLEATKAAMASLGKAYEPVIYQGSDHMFVRLGEEPRDANPANIVAGNAALARLQELLAKPGK
jgi:carboxymethylenebutenolidase